MKKFLVCSCMVFGAFAMESLKGRAGSVIRRASGPLRATSSVGGSPRDSSFRDETSAAFDNLFSTIQGVNDRVNDVMTLMQQLQPRLTQYDTQTAQLVSVNAAQRDHIDQLSSRLTSLKYFVGVVAIIQIAQLLGFLTA